MKRLCLFATWIVLGAFAVLSQTADDLNSGLKLDQDPESGTYTLSWWGAAGRSYYILQSEDLKTWNYFPVEEHGNDNVLSWGFASTSERNFFRLKHVENPGGATSLDSDGDGISNLDEIQSDTDPFDEDSDDDGWDDEEERRSNSDPNNGQEKPTLLPAEEYVRVEARWVTAGGSELSSQEEHTSWVYHGGWTSTSGWTTYNPTSFEGSVSYSDGRTPPEIDSIASAQAKLSDIDGLTDGWYVHPANFVVSSHYGITPGGPGTGLPEGEYPDGTPWYTTYYADTDTDWNGGVMDIRLAWSDNAPKADKLYSVTKRFVKVLRKEGVVVSAEPVFLTIQPESEESNAGGNGTPGRVRLSANTMVSDEDVVDALLPIDVEILCPWVATPEEWQDAETMWGGKSQAKYFDPYQPQSPDNNDLKLRIRVGGGEITPEMRSQVEYELSIYSQEFRKSAHWTKFNVKSADVLSQDKTSLYVTVPKDDVLSFYPADSNDFKSHETMTVDFATTGKFTDSDALELAMSGDTTFSVNCKSTDGINFMHNWSPQGQMALWSSMVTRKNLVWGGLNFIEARPSSAPGGARATVVDQADLLYFSGHGHSSDARLDVTSSGVYPADVKWDSDLDIVIVAGCSIFDVGDFNGHYDNDGDGTKEPGPSSHEFAGEKWADVGPYHLIGYNYEAPADDQEGDDAVLPSEIIKTWSDNKLLQGNVEAWRMANNNSSGRNACVIVHSSNYYYFKRTGFTGAHFYSWELVPKTLW